MSIDTKHIYICDFCDQPQAPEQLFESLRGGHICNRCVSVRGAMAEQKQKAPILKSLDDLVAALDRIEAASKPTGVCNKPTHTHIYGTECGTHVPGQREPEPLTPREQYLIEVAQAKAAQQLDYFRDALERAGKI